MFATVAFIQPTEPDPQQDRPATSTDAPGSTGRLLGLVRALIDYGKQLAASLLQRTETTDLRPAMRAFGTPDIARILARIACGLLRAQALEDKILHNAARLDAPKQPKPLAAASPRDPSVSRPPRDRQFGPDLAPLSLPTPEQIAAKVRRQSIGAVIADICRDLGIMPDHPLWPEFQALIQEYRGNYARLVIEILRRPRRFLFERALAASQAKPLALVCATGPP